VNKVIFGLNLGLRWRDYLEYSYLGLSTLVLRTGPVWLESVTMNIYHGEHSTFLAVSWFPLEGLSLWFILCSVCANTTKDASL